MLGSRDMAIFVLTTTITKLITLPLAHAHGVMTTIRNCLHSPSHYVLLIVV